MTAEEMLWEYGGDILRSPTMDQERTIPQHGSTTCYDHSVAVTLCSIRLAQKWGWDVDWRSLVRGALLHDYFLYNWREHNRDHKLHGFYHARKAMENAQRDFGLNPLEANIIHRHMFPLNPTPPKYKESVVVTCADKICATRADTMAKLRERGFTGPDSATNFLFVTTSRMPCKQIFERLRQKGVLIRYFSAPRLSDYLRIPIGTPEQMQRFFEELDLILG